MTQSVAGVLTRCSSIYCRAYSKILLARQNYTEGRELYQSNAGIYYVAATGRYTSVQVSQIRRVIGRVLCLQGDGHMIMFFSLLWSPLAWLVFMYCGVMWLGYVERYHRFLFPTRTLSEAFVGYFGHKKRVQWRFCDAILVTMTHL